MLVLSQLGSALALATLAVCALSVAAWLLAPGGRGALRPLPDEDAALGALRPQDLAPGQYRLPHATDARAMADPAFREKLERGPVALLTVFAPGPFSIGNAVALTLLHRFAVTLLAAGTAAAALGPGAPFGDVFRIVAAVAAAAYVGALFPASIWWGRPWKATWRDAVEGVAHGLATGAVLAWLWPR